MRVLGVDPGLTRCGIGVVDGVGGGRVSLVEVATGNIVVLKFGGGCHGCGMADVTLKQGIETTLRARLPEISQVRDATDHASGENPYFRDTHGASAVT